MYVVELVNLETGKEFQKPFYDEWQKNKFVKRCNYSKKVKIIGVFRYG
ncbi:MAG: hypothetical protein IJ568_06190 [Bacilli bacterium]|nr:hypothetical protein [Bacilli bacterium]